MSIKLNTVLVLLLLLLFSTTIYSEGYDYDKFIKGPYLIYTGKNTDMKILWQPKSTKNIEIKIGIDKNYNLKTLQSSNCKGKNNIYIAHITNLKPNTKYFYIVGDQTGSFFTAPETSAKKLKFTVYGDTRNGIKNHNEIAKQMVKSFEADEAFQTFTLSVGDLVGEGKVDKEWDEQFFDPYKYYIRKLMANKPFISCVGNHEFYPEEKKSSSKFGKYFPYNFVQSYYWSFDYGPAHFVIVDQFDDPNSEHISKQQRNWIENDLKQSTKMWNFLVLHAPGWSSGNHSAENEPEMKYVQDVLHPLCKKYCVPIIFAGHNHLYARAFKDNVYHITTGGGGTSLTNINNQEYIQEAQKQFHFCEVEINHDLLIMRIKNNKSIIIDEVIISKGGNPLGAILEMFID